MAAVMPAGRLLNGLDVDELRDVAREIERDPRRGQVEFRARPKGSGTLEQFREIHGTVVRTSPNYFNIAQPVTIAAQLVVE
jgi:hypothetical protein